jgi:hypothetical protein
VTSKRTARPRSKIGITAGLALAGLLLAACGGAVAAGSAAVLGDERIPTSEVADQVAQINTARGLPADAANAATTASVIQRLVITNLVDQAAQRLDATVSDGAVDAELLQLEASAGGREALDEALLQSDIPPSAASDQVRVSLLVREMGLLLDPNGDPQTQNTSVFEYVVALSEELDVSISPRFGTWNPDQLALGPLPDDLSTPAPQAEPTAG